MLIADIDREWGIFKLQSFLDIRQQLLIIPVIADKIEIDLAGKVLKIVLQSGHKLRKERSLNHSAIKINIESVKLLGVLIPFRIPADEHNNSHYKL